MVKLDRRGIPEKVLTGKVPKYMSVYRAYTAHMAREVMVQLNRSFWVRAKGGSDDLGNKWKPLSPRTHAYKPLSPMDKKTYELNGRRTRGLLTPAQDRIWRGIFARELKRAQKRGDANPKKIAAEKAWAVLKGKGAVTKIGLNRITDINIRTGRLVAATRPGAVANNRYYQTKDQIVQIRPRSIKIKFNISYIKKIDAVRPVVPDNIDKWIEKAHEIAIVEAKKIYDRIQGNTPDRKKSTRSRPTSRRRRRRN